MQRPEFGDFLPEHFLRRPLRRGVDPHIGDGIEPEAHLLVEALEAVELQAVEKIALDIGHRRFHSAFLLRLSRRTGLDLKAPMLCEVNRAQMESGRSAGGMS